MYDFEPTFSTTSSGGTAPISDSNNKRLLRYKPNQISEKFIQIEPKLFPISANEPVGISQINAMREDLVVFQANGPDQSEPVLIGLNELNILKQHLGPTVGVTALESEIEQCNKVFEEIFSNLESTAGNINTNILKLEKVINEVDEKLQKLRAEKNPNNLNKINGLKIILPVLERYRNAYIKDLDQVADFYRILYLAAKPNKTTSTVRVNRADHKFYINDLSDPKTYVQGITNSKPSDEGEARISFTLRSNLTSSYATEAKDFVTENITFGVVPQHLESMTPQLRIDFSEEYIRNENSRRKVVCLDLDTLTNKNIFIEALNGIYRDIGKITGNSYEITPHMNLNRRSHHFPLIDNDIRDEQEFARLVQIFKYHLTYTT